MYNYSKRDLRINGVKIKPPHEFETERYNITNAARMSSGYMAMDLIGKKVKFLLTYKALSERDFQIILNQIDTNNMFFTVSYTEFGRRHSRRMYVGAIKDKDHRDGVRSNVRFNLIEQ